MPGVFLWIVVQCWTRDFIIFYKNLWGGRDFIEGGGVLEVKYYRSGENGWGIVFMVTEGHRSIRVIWGYGGV